MADADEGGAGPGLAGAGPVQVRREQHVGRYRAATGLPRQRTLFRRLPSPAGLSPQIPAWQEVMADTKPADLNPANTSLAAKFRTMEYGVAPEDSGLSLAWLDQFKRRFGHFIGGAWTAPAQGRYFETSDPSTGEKIADIAQGRAADVDAAVRAARAALQGWQALTPHARARFLYALARQVQKHSRRLSVLETIDNGKPIRESRDIDIPLVARHFY